MTYDDDTMLRLAVNNTASDTFKPTENWQEFLVLGKKGLPRALFVNALIALRRAPVWNGVLAFDSFHNRIHLRRKAPWMKHVPTDRQWMAPYDALVCNWLQENGIYVSPETAGIAVATTAHDREFHPVRNYLATCHWDGDDRGDRWLHTHLGAPDTEYTRAVGSKWLISNVARIMKPGCKADCALILEGPQGILKSSALEALAQPWFTDDLADFGSKDSAVQLAGAWIIELAELDSISRSEVSKIKAFMSRTTDRFRPPYGRNVIEQPRQCGFAGTANNTQYLRDETGNRRFWPVLCSNIDLDRLRQDRDQLWAEARDRYETGENWWLDTRDLVAAATEEQDARYQADPWQPLIEDFIFGRSDIAVGEILSDALKVDTQRWGQADQNRVARCLLKLGWEKFRQRDGARLSWRYRRPECS